MRFLKQQKTMLELHWRGCVLLIRWAACHTTSNECRSDVLKSADLSSAMAGISRICKGSQTWVGDYRAQLSAVQQLETFFPKSHLAGLRPGYLVDLWKTFPYVDEIIPFQKRERSGLLGRI